MREGRVRSEAAREAEADAAADAGAEPARERNEKKRSSSKKRERGFFVKGSIVRGRARRARGRRRARAGARGVRRASSTCVLSRNRRETHVFLRLGSLRGVREGKSLRDCRRCLHARLAGRDALEHFSRFDELSVQAGHAVAQGHVRLVLVVIPRGALAPHGVPETRIPPR